MYEQMKGIIASNFEKARTAAAFNADAYDNPTAYQEHAESKCAIDPLRIYGLALQVGLTLDNMGDSRGSFSTQFKPDLIRMRMTAQSGPNHGALPESYVYYDDEATEEV
jgi:hypothetical protein